MTKIFENRSWIKVLIIILAATILIAILGLMIGIGSSIGSKWLETPQPTELSGLPETITSTGGLTDTPAPSYTPSPTNTITLTTTYTPTSTKTLVVLSAQVNGNNAYLRSGPDLYHPIISHCLDYPSDLVIISRNSDGTWFLVETESGLIGWLRENWITLNVNIDQIPIEQFIPTAPPTFTPTPTIKPTSNEQPPQYP
jgi:hypothetical protein